VQPPLTNAAGGSGSPTTDASDTSSDPPWIFFLFPFPFFQVFLPPLFFAPGHNLHASPPVNRRTLFHTCERLRGGFTPVFCISRESYWNFPDGFYLYVLEEYLFSLSVDFLTTSGVLQALFFQFFLYFYLSDSLRSGSRRHRSIPSQNFLEDPPRSLLQESKALTPLNRLEFLLSLENFICAPGAPEYWSYLPTPHHDFEFSSLI